MGGCVQCIMHSLCQPGTVCFLDLGQVLRVEVTFCVTVGATNFVSVTIFVARLQNRCQVSARAPVPCAGRARAPVPCAGRARAPVPCAGRARAPVPLAGRARAPVPRQVEIAHQCHVRSR